MLSARQSIDKLMSYCEKEGFKGYDPYDGLNSRLFQGLPFAGGSKFARLAWTQLFKRLPFNLRPLTGIKKEYNPKGLALFLSGYANLVKAGDGKGYMEKIHFLADKLIEMKSPGYSGSCWGYNFAWQSKAFYFPKATPTVVASTFAANALMDAYDVTGESRFLEEGLSTKEFVLLDLNRTEDQQGNFTFSYSPLDKTSVFNASLLGARLLSRAYAYTGDDLLAKEAKKAVAYCCARQNADGSWFYSTLPWHQWVDNFHTGFNLECLADYSRYTGDGSFQKNTEIGLKYYLENFFDSEGRAAYYNKSVYPVDIHAPSQLFVTLDKTGTFNEYKNLADKVLSWTISNMQAPEGYFYYQKRKLITNKIPYMRWSQAWIFYGLSYYLLNETGPGKQRMKPEDLRVSLKHK